MLTKYILIILSSLIFLIISISFIRKKYRSHSMYKLTNLLVYFLELFLAGTLLNLLFDAHAFQSSKSGFLIFKDYVYANSIYSIIITMIIKFWDGTTIDSINSLQKQVKDFLLLLDLNDIKLLRSSFNSFENKYSFLIKIGSLEKFTFNQVNEVTIAIQSFLSSEIEKNDLVIFLKKTQILLEDERNIINFGWQSSLFLRVLKN